MKKQPIIVAFSLAALFLSCGNSENKKYSTPNLPKIYRSWEIDVLGGTKDTINVVDVDGHKQGLWIVRNLDKSPYTNDVDTFMYKDDVVIKSKK